MLDDSTCKATRQLVDEKAAEWAERGVKCEVVRRTNRQGYKAGALKDVSGPSVSLPVLPVQSSHGPPFVVSLEPNAVKGIWASEVHPWITDCCALSMHDILCSHGSIVWRKHLLARLVAV